MSTELMHTEASTSIAHRKAEMEIFMEQAQLNKRDMKEFMKQAIVMATYSEEIAASCIFSLPRKMKNEKTGQYEQGYIKGKSIRLAEIILSIYTNIIVEARIDAVTTKSVTVTGIIMDVQNRTIVKQPATVNINGTHSDAAKLAIAACTSLAIRNAVLRLIPGAFVDEIYNEAVKCAIGDQKTFSVKRKEIFARIAKLGIPQEKIFAFYDKKTIEDFTPENMEEIVGIGSAIKAGELKIDKAFTKTATSDDAVENIDDSIATKKPFNKSNINVEKNPTTDQMEVINTETGEVLAGQEISSSFREFKAVHHQLMNAKSLDTLDIAADLIKETPSDKQQELTSLYRQRQKELNGELSV